MTYTDTSGQIYLLGLEDAETYRTFDEKGRDEQERMHRTPVKVNMKSVEGIVFKKLRCSFIDCQGLQMMDMYTSRKTSRSLQLDGTGFLNQPK